MQGKEGKETKNPAKAVTRSLYGRTNNPLTRANSGDLNMPDNTALYSS
jgi:hypothetical protein